MSEPRFRPGLLTFPPLSPAEAHQAVGQRLVVRSANDGSTVPNQLGVHQRHCSLANMGARG